MLNDYNEADDNIQQTDKKYDDFKLVGFDETLAELQRPCPSFKDIMKPANFTYAFAAGSMIATEMESGLTATSSLGAKVVASAFIASSMQQFYEFYSTSTELQDWQNKFIAALPVTDILNYEPRSYHAMEAVNKEDVVYNLNNYKRITVELKNNDVFELESISSMKLLGGSAISIAISVVFAVYYANLQSLQLAQGSEEELGKPPEEWIALLAASAPLGKSYQYGVNIIFQQSAKLFAAISKVVKLYENEIDEIPKELMEVAGFFMNEKYRTANLLKISEFKTAKALHGTSNRVETLERQVASLTKRIGDSGNDSNEQKSLIFSVQAKAEVVAATRTRLTLDEEENTTVDDGVTKGEEANLLPKAKATGARTNSAQKQTTKKNDGPCCIC